MRYKLKIQYVHMEVLDEIGFLFGLRLTLRFISIIISEEISHFPQNLGTQK